MVVDISCTATEQLRGGIGSCLNHPFAQTYLYCVWHAARSPPLPAAFTFIRGTRTPTCTVHFWFCCFAFVCAYYMGCGALILRMHGCASRAVCAHTPAPSAAYHFAPLHHGVTYPPSRFSPCLRLPTACSAPFGHFGPGPSAVPDHHYRVAPTPHTCHHLLPHLRTTARTHARNLHSVYSGHSSLGGGYGICDSILYTCSSPLVHTHTLHFATTEEYLFSLLLLLLRFATSSLVGLFFFFFFFFFFHLPTPVFSSHSPTCLSLAQTTLPALATPQTLGVNVRRRLVDGDMATTCSPLRFYLPRRDLARVCGALSLSDAPTPTLSAAACTPARSATRTLRRYYTRIYLRDGTRDVVRLTHTTCCGCTNCG